jgi:hypothetical protein
VKIAFLSADHGANSSHDLIAVHGHILPWMPWIMTQISVGCSTEAQHLWIHRVKHEYELCETAAPESFDLFASTYHELLMTLHRRKPAEAN